MCTAVDYVGHRWSSVNGRATIVLLQDTMARIADFPSPMRSKELLGFLGTTRWIAGFVPDLERPLHTLNKLASKNAHWHWSSAQQTAFDAAKCLCTDKLRTAHLIDWSKGTLVLCTDASDWGMGGALFQRD